MNNTLQDRKFTPEEVAYSDYVVQHINTVLSVFVTLRQLFKDRIDKSLLDKLGVNVLNHDKSKGSEEEFDGYRQYFYPEKGQEKDVDKFNFAWLHHIHNNPHHWEHWVLAEPAGSVALEMPELYAFEMLLDWTAMSLKFGNVPSDYFSGHAGEMIFHSKTRSFIEYWLPHFDSIYYTILGAR